MRYRVGKFSEFSESSPITIRIAPNFHIVLIKSEDRIYAINDECPHKGGPLGEGEIEGTEIVCPWHFWRFDIRTGVCTDGGDEDEKVACYNVIVEGEDVFVDVPDKRS